MTRISARNVARVLSVAAAVVATAAIAGASDAPLSSERIFISAAERIDTAQPTTRLAWQPGTLADQPRLARNEGTISWPYERVTQEEDRAAEHAEARQAGWKDSGSSWPQPNRYASFLATAALVAFFFLRRIV